MLEIAEGSRLRKARGLSDGSSCRALHVLLVDDDLDVCEVVEAQLCALGCSVTAVVGGRMALKVARDYGIPIDVLLTDVEMPGMTGPELALRMQSIRPETTVVLMSAGSCDVVGPHSLFSPGRVLAKPFSKEALEDRLLEIR